MTCEEFQSSSNFNLNILYTNSLLSAIPKDWKSKIHSSTFNYEQTPKFSLKLNQKEVPIFKVTSRKVYWEIVNCKIKKPTALETWLDLFPFLEHENWGSVYTLVYKITTEPYLQTFQYKIINRTI